MMIPRIVLPSHPNIIERCESMKHIYFNPSVQMLLEEEIYFFQEYVLQIEFLCDEAIPERDFILKNCRAFVWISNICEDLRTFLAENLFQLQWC